ncbi:hypothetical protein PSPO01_15318 [Paraphaeosphaeria sporulosa]
MAMDHLSVPSTSCDCGRCLLRQTYSHLRSYPSIPGRDRSSPASKELAKALCRPYLPHHAHRVYRQEGWVAEEAPGGSPGRATHPNFLIRTFVYTLRHVAHQIQPLRITLSSPFTVLSSRKYVQ